MSVGSTSSFMRLMHKKETGGVDLDDVLVIWLSEWTELDCSDIVGSAAIYTVSARAHTNTNER